MSIIKKYAIILSLPVISLASCVSEGNNTGIEYAPNMYISQAYEPYSQEKEFDYNPNGMTMRLPVNGTIARGQLDYIYPYPNTAEGYEASVSFQPQFAATKENVQEGERLYNIYCWHCHGKKGANDGPIFKTKKMNPPPWAGYDDPYIKELPVGKIYHTIQYGKGFMGSHAAMLNPKQRWQVIHYVKYLSLGDAFTFASGEDDLSVTEVEVSDSTEAATN